MDRGEDSIRVKATHDFKRTDFKVGKPQGEESTDDALTLELQLTLKNS